MSNDQEKHSADQTGMNSESAGEPPVAASRQSTRRGFVRGGLAKAAYLVPAVATLAAPTSVFAASGGGPSCGSVDAPCVDVSDCCANMKCNGMDAMKCCGDVGFACDVAGDCCGMTSCTGGMCV